jgi:chemotaxis family two-component system response regulator Rcp1
METKFRPIEILLVEDNPGDVKLTQMALENAKVINNLHVVNNGKEALEFLFSQKQIKPDIVLLDLNLPIIDGREVLKKIKEDSNLKRTPVVILTSSKAEEDIIKTYDLHANCYITKPIDLEQFLNVIKTIEDFWLTIVKLPT